MDEKNKKKLILDTNFLLIPGQFMVDIFTELEKVMQEPYELCMVEKSLDELKKLTLTGKEKDRFAAKLAVVLIGQKDLKRLPCSKGDNSVDDIIVSYAGKDTFVATEDRILRRRLKEKGSGVIGLRQGKYLVVI
ncbi:MAG: nucleotide-binding protein [archaeon]